MDVLHIERKLNEAESTPQSVSLEIINGIVGDLYQVLKRSASACGMSKPMEVTDGEPRKRNLRHKPWYNTDCEDALHTMMQCKNKYRKLTISENLNLIRNSCKQYKAATNKAFKKYKKHTITKLRKLHTENPKEYWKIIQGKQNSKVIEQIFIETFQEHFTKLTSGNTNKTTHRY